MADKNNTEDEDMMLASAVAVMAADIACIATFEHVLLRSTSSNSTDYSSSSSSGSTGRTPGGRKRTRVLAEQIDRLSSQIGEAIEAIRSREDFSSALYSEVMKYDGYDEILLGKAFDYLLEH